jgi:transposase
MEAVDVKIGMFKNLFELAGKDDVTILEACKEMDVSPSTYYKYKKIYDEGGYEYLREMLHGYTNVGLRHMSVEVKTKLYDIIREHPDFGPKRISDELNTEKYGYVEVLPRLIYDELRRAKLNLQRQREKFVQRGGKRRLKPPGTPLLTLDGEVMVGFRSDEQEVEKNIFNVPSTVSPGKAKEILLSKKSNREGNSASISTEDQDLAPLDTSPAPNVKISSDENKADDNVNIISVETNKKER